MIKSYCVCFSVLLLLLLSSNLNAQFVNYGTDPASLRWRHAKTPHYQLIFPAGSDSTAYNYARYLEMAFPHETKTIGHTIKRRFPVILHPGNMLSNGMVAFAPRRMEILPTPSPTIYGQSWDRQLVIHESRHVLQTDKLMQGIFKPFYYLLGEQVSGVSSLAVPSWFFEGDAVVAETGMSRSGRGRLAEFHMPFRTQKIGGRFFSFDKWYMGSYKDHTSTYYALGYHMASYARYAYGADIWDKVTCRVPRRFFSIPPFQNALKHYTGSTLKRLFEDTYAYLSEEWESQDSLYQRSGFGGLTSTLTPQHKIYTSYQYPLAVDSETVIALKSGLEEVSSIVEVKNGKEKRLAYVGAVSGKPLLSGNKVYWIEYIPGIRWTHQNYTVLKSIDLQTLDIHTLTRKDRLLTPAIGGDASRMAFSRPDENGRNEVLLMDAGSGNTLASYPVKGNAFVKDLVFLSDDELAALVVGEEGISLLRLDCRDSEWSVLLGPVSVNITSLYKQGGYLYFESGANGTNNIYRLEIASGKPYRLTNARFGAFTPSLSAGGEHLLFADYQPDGHRVLSVPVDKLRAVPADLNHPYRYELAETLAGQEGYNLDTAVVKDIPFDVKPYRKLSNLFRIHSWAPFYYDAMEVASMQSDDFTSVVKPGVMMLSQNQLNTMVMQVGWYLDDGDHHGKMAFSYMGLFPVIDFSVDYGGKTIDLRWKEDQDGKRYDEVTPAGRRMLEAEMRVYAPFDFTRSHMIRGFQPSVSYYYTNNKYEQFRTGKLRDFQYVLSELLYYNYRRKAVRDIYPRLGYMLRLQHLFSPFNTENFGNMYAARFTTYLPGLRTNDGLMLRLAYQYQATDGKAMYFPKRLLEKTRGYEYTYRTRQLFTAKADYAFNLFCPDVSIGSIVYIKRLRGNLFYDFAANQAHKGQKNWDLYNAPGADLIVDCNFFRFNFPISAGVRFIQPIDYGSFRVEGLFTMSF